MVIQERFHVRVYVCVILLNDQNQVLLIKRSATGCFDDCWGVPGGSLEPEESLLQAAQRELAEETSIIVSENDLQLVHILQLLTHKSCLGFYFYAKRWKGKPQNLETDKHSEIGWFALDNLPEKLTPGAANALAGFSNNSLLTIVN